MSNAIEKASELWVCGVRGSFVTHGEAYAKTGTGTTCYVLRRGAYALVIDCGTGLANAEPIIKDCAYVDVLLTHYHYDHMLGLLCAPWLFHPGCRLRIHGPGGDADVRRALEEVARPPYWPVPLPLDTCAIRGLAPGQTLRRREGVRIRTLAATHPNGGLLYRVETDEGAVAFLFDSEHTGKEAALIAFAKDCRIAVCDGMVTEAEYPAYRGWGHSTVESDLALARAASVARLLITHHAPDRTDKQIDPLEAEARAQFPNCDFAREGACYRL